MLLSTKIDGDPESIRSTAGWLRTMSGRLDDSAQLVREAAANTQGSWEGPAADGFRTTMTQVRPRITEVAKGYDQVRGALDAHANSLSSVQKEMERARRVASDAGLTVVGEAIYEPNKPPTPQPLGVNPTEAEKTSYRNAQTILGQYDLKAKAYKEAARIVAAARTAENKALQTLKSALAFIAKDETSFTADLLSGLAGAWYSASSRGAERQASKFRKLQARYTAKESRSRARYARLRHQRIGRFNFVKKFLNGVRQDYHLDAAKSSATKAASAGATAERYALKAAKLGRYGKRIPLIGPGVAVAGGVYDYASGKESANQAAISTLGGIGAGIAASALTGAVVGSAIPVPVVGTVAGAVVGAGVGTITSMQIDKHWGALRKLDPFD